MRLLNSMYQRNISTLTPVKRAWASYLDVGSNPSVTLQAFLHSHEGQMPLAPE